MKILDRYILATFVVSLLIVMVAMMGLSLLLDLFFNINKFLDMTAEARRASFWTILVGMGNYYFYKSFDYFQLLAAPAMLVAAAATLVRFTRSRELVGIKAAGISIYRVMWPIIVVGLIVDGCYILNQELIIPSIGVQLARDPDDLAFKEEFAVDFIRDEHNNIIYAPVYDPEKCEMRAEPRRFSDGSVVLLARVRIFLRDSAYQARGTIEAEAARWDPKAHGWRLVNGLRLPPLKEASLVDRIPTEPEGDKVDFYATNVGPEAIMRHRCSDFHRYMSYRELKSLAEDPMRGNRRQLQVTMHQHVTSPILNILLLLLGLPFVAGRDDKNYFVSVGIAVCMVIGVFVVTFASTAFGNAGHITPLLAAWIPVFLILPASVVSMETLRT